MKINNKSKIFMGHICALITILLWGTTFISTKILLIDYKPVEILIYRFIIGLIALFIIYPHRLKNTTLKQEGTFALAGLCGICLYYLLENIALTYTLASNVGVIISIAPFFTAILSFIFLKNKEKPKINFFIGFVVAICGIFLISFNGSKLELNPMGDILALLASLVWAFYSILTKKISTFGYRTILTTRKTFFYGILFMIPAAFLFDFKIESLNNLNPLNLFNILYLGFGASALCFVLWNHSLKILGTLKTSIYIYMIPVVTVITSAIILKEKMSILIISGTILTLCGLFLSRDGFYKKIINYFKK